MCTFCNNFEQNHCNIFILSCYRNQNTIETKVGRCLVHFLIQLVASKFRATFSRFGSKLTQIFSKVVSDLNVSNDSHFFLQVGEIN